MVRVSSQLAVFFLLFFLPTDRPSNNFSNRYGLITEPVQYARNAKNSRKVMEEYRIMELTVIRCWWWTGNREFI